MISNRRSRWALPVVAAVALVAGALVIPTMASAQGVPDLPALNAADLLAKAQTSNITGVSGEVAVTENLGIPSLPANVDPSASDFTQYLSGTHSFHVWASNNGNVKLQIPNGASETDLVHNGQTLWLWQSDGQKVTRVMLPNQARGDNESQSADVAMTPQQLAQRFLSATGSTTEISMSGSTRVAGRAAYQLQIIPKSTTSLIGSVRIAFDSTNFAPLEVQLFARDAAKPAIDVSYSSVKFSNPKASVFNFSPPSGVKVTNETLPAKNSASGSGSDPTRVMPAVVGTGWDSVVIIPSDMAPKTLSNKVHISKVHKGYRHQLKTANAQQNPDSTSSLLMKDSTPVSGAFGSGRLFHTSLVNVVVLTDGRIAIGSTNQQTLLSLIPQS